MPTIKHKFSPKDKVFVFHNNQVVQAEVYSVTINHASYRATPVIHYKLNSSSLSVSSRIRYMGEEVSFEEDRLFKSKATLIKTL
jgi:hypothetical protein